MFSALVNFYACGLTKERSLLASKLRRSIFVYRYTDIVIKKGVVETSRKMEDSSL